MENLKKCKTQQKPNFNEETHTYTLNGKELTPVTKVLSQTGISPNYSNVPSDNLEKAASRGSFVHQEIHDYLVNGVIGVSDELNSFIQWFENSNLELVASEEMVWNDSVAGTFDILLRHKDTRKLVMIDIKTTAEPHLESTSYQTSIYSYLYENLHKIETIEENLMLWFDKNGNLIPIKLFRQPNEKVERVLDCFAKGITYQEEMLPTISKTDLMNLEYLESSLEHFEILQKQFKEKEEQLKEYLLNQMEQNQIYTLKTDKIIVSYKKGYEKKSFDSKKFKEEQPKEYEKYSKTTLVKASVSIKERKDK